MHRSSTSAVRHRLLAAAASSARRLSVLARYDAELAAGRLKPDPIQRAAATELNKLHSQVTAYTGTLLRYERELRDWKAARRRHEERRRQLEQAEAERQARRPAILKLLSSAMQRLDSSTFFPCSNASMLFLSIELISIGSSGRGRLAAPPAG